ECADANRSTIVFVEKGEKKVAVHFVEAVFIHAELAQRLLSNFPGNASGGANLGEIAGAAEQAVGDARRATAAARDFLGAALIHLDIQDFGGAMKNDEQIFGRIELEAMNDAEAGAQGRGDESGAGGGADESEVVEVEGMNARAGALAD